MQVWLLILTFAGVEFEGGQYQERAWCVRAGQAQTQPGAAMPRARWRCELRTFP
jgi:hypothetical protein